MAWASNYVTAVELAQFVRIDDTSDDAQLGLAIAAASRAVDRACNRQFGKVDAPVERFYTAKLDPVIHRMAIDIDDLMVSTGLVVEVDTDGEGIYSDAVTSYELRPRNATADGRPWTQLVVGRGASVGFPSTEDAVRVTGTWGWSAVPDAIKEATALQASRLLSRRDAPFGVAGSPQAGSEVRLLAKLDPDVEVVVAPYRRLGWVFA